jgi:zinc protease
MSLSLLKIMGRLAATGLLVATVAAQTVQAAQTVEKVKSPGGIEAWLIRDAKNPIIALRFSFAGGAAHDPDGKSGLANLLASTLDEGAGDMDSPTFQKRLEDQSIELSFQASHDRLTGSLTSLVETKQAAFDMMRLALTAPRFDQEAVDRVRNQIAAGIRSAYGNPGYWAQRAMNEVLFKGHPYARPISGSPESLAAIGRDDLKRAVQAGMTRDGLKVAVSGAIDAKELGQVLDRLFGALPAKGGLPAVASTKPQGAGETILVPRAIPQTIIRMAHGGLPVTDPDWHAAIVLNYVVGGGGFSSRLMEEVREKRGLTYGISSGLVTYDHADLMQIGSSSVNDKAAQTMAIAREIWGDVAKNGVTEKELADAKTYLTGSYPLRFSDNEAIAGLLLGLQENGFASDYIARRNALVDAVTLADVKRVAMRLMDPAKLTTVMVGQPKDVTPTRTAYEKIDG